MFFKVTVLKNVAVLSRKHLCWNLLLIKLQSWRPVFLLKKKLQHRWSSVNISKYLRTIFFTEHLLFITFPKFSVIIQFFGQLWVQNWHSLYFLRHCFFSLMTLLESVFHGLSILCFNTKSFGKYNFRTLYNIGSSTILSEPLKFRNNSRIKVTSHSNLLWKLWIWVFWISCCVIIFL